MISSERLYHSLRRLQIARILLNLIRFMHLLQKKLRIFHVFVCPNRRESETRLFHFADSAGGDDYFCCCCKSGWHCPVNCELPELCSVKLGTAVEEMLKLRKLRNFFWLIDNYIKLLLVRLINLLVELMRHFKLLYRDLQLSLNLLVLLIKSCKHPHLLLAQFGTFMHQIGSWIS